MTPESLTVDPIDSLTEAQSAAVRALAAAAPGAADNPPLSDQALLSLSSGGPVHHLLIGGRTPHDPVRGYLQYQVEDGTAQAELLVDTADLQATPALAAALLGELAIRTAPAEIEVWAHGDGSPVHGAARSAGLAPARSLFQLRRPLAGATGDAADPAHPDEAGGGTDGVRIRSFRPGEDDAAWLEVNRRAFSHHPEQGSWTQRDLQARIESGWFEPAGFLIAERDGRMLGYHWTKIHPDALDDAGTPLGEVYVLGVDPDAQGLKLGRRLLVAGLRFLAGRGLHTVLLYVDADNEAAVRLYRSQGFETFSTDTQYRPVK